jgi:hypothetical protein
MAESAITPQSSYKDRMQALLREAGPRLFMRYYDTLLEDNVKVDDLRKGVELIINATDVALEKKTDQNSNLAVFNITFDMNGMKAEVQAAPAQLVEQVEDAKVIEAPAETPAIETVDVQEMFKLLDGMLGDEET